MRRLDVHYRPAARRDLRNIARYLRESGASPGAVRRFIGRIELRCLKIGDAPLGGRSRDDLLPGVRSVPFEDSAVIFYEVVGDRVRIINVFYGGRDYEALYRDEGAPPGG